MISNKQYPEEAKSNQLNHVAEEGNKNVILNITDQEIFFAKQRYKLHLARPDEGVSEDILRNYFFKKYGF